MLTDPCLLCGRLDCPDEEEHTRLVRLDMDTWPPDEDDPDEPDSDDPDQP